MSQRFFYLPIQSVLNAAARLIIVRLLRTSHISTVMFENLHWLPRIARIKLKVRTLTNRSYTGHAPKYLRDLIRLLFFTISLRLQRSFDWLLA